MSMNDQTDVELEGDDEITTPKGQVIPLPNTLAVRRRADMEMAVDIAHRYPRHLPTVVKELRAMVLANEAWAKTCIYALPRAGKPIVGPSVGLADAVASVHKNSYDDADVLEIDTRNKVVRCKGYFIDLETNRWTFSAVSRRISDKQGRLYTDDMIGITTQACLQIARRNAIFRGVKRLIWYPIFQEALIKVRGTEQTLPERRDEIIALFATHGVDPKRIAAALGVQKRDEITIDHLVILTSMFEELKEGLTTAEEMFDPRKMTGWVPDVGASPLSDDEEGEAPGAGAASPAAKPEKPQAPAKRARKARVAPEPAPAQGQPAQATAPAASAASPGGTQAPANPPGHPEAYLDYARAWLQTEPTGFAVEQRWKQERSMRNQLGMTSEMRAPLEAEMKARIAALNQSGGK